MATSRRAFSVTGAPAMYRSQYPADYYFFVQTNRAFNVYGDPSATEVAFTSAGYFDNNGYQSDWHIGNYVVGHRLAELGLAELSEGMFSTTMDPDDVRARLLSLGFRENQDFAALMNDEVDIRSEEDSESSREDASSENVPSATRRNIFDQINDEAPTSSPQPPEKKATAYDKLLEDDVIPGEIPSTPATPIEIDIIEEDPRKITLPCDTCGHVSIYAFKAAKRILGCCGSSGCMKCVVTKLEHWAHEAQSKSWDLLSGQDILEPEKPRLSIKEEVLEFQKAQGLQQTGELDAKTEAALRKAGRSGMIPIWSSRLSNDIEFQMTKGEPI